MTTTSTMRQQEENLRNKAQEMGEKAKEVGEKAKETASNVFDKAKDAASNVADRAKGIASNVYDKTKDAASALGQRAEDATHAVGKGMESLAGTVRHNLPTSGVIGGAASSMASGLESGGRYLDNEGLSGIGEDMVNLIRRNPIPALLIGIGLGFFLAKATTSRHA